MTTVVIHSLERVETPALFVFSNGIRIHVRTAEQLHLVPGDVVVTFEYAGFHDGITVYRERTP